MTEKTADFWMRKAVEAAWPYRGLTAPNPPVGCVLVRDANLPPGAHTKAGAPHGEIRLQLCRRCSGSDSLCHA